MQATAPRFFASADSNRVGAAVLVSLIAHLAVLTLLPGMRPGSASVAQPLSVTFLRPVIETAQEVMRALDPPPPPEIAPQPRKPVPNRAATPVMTQRAPAPAPRTTRPAAEPTPVSVSPSVPEPEAVEPPSSLPARPEAATAAPPVARAAPSPDASIREYEAAAGRAISAAVPRRYPAIAHARRWEGRPVVRVHFRKGALVATLEQPSGFEALDERALELTNSTVLPPLPAQLAQHDFEFLLPFDFRLNTR